MAKEKEQKMIYETLHIKLKIKKYKRHLKTGGEIRCSQHYYPLQNICVANDQGYVPFVVNTFWSFPDKGLITGFVTRVT
jgi:hypothetical protein